MWILDGSLLSQMHSSVKDKEDQLVILMGDARLG